MAILCIEPVQSLDSPELEIYRTLRRLDEHERKGKDAGKSKGSDSSAPPDKKGDGGQKDDGWETAK